MKKKSKEIFRKAIGILGVALSAMILPILIINLILLVEGWIYPNTVPDLFGVTPMIVVTDSMNPVICGGDMIIDRKTPADQVKEGDIISFFDPSSEESSVVTHRVQEVLKDEAGHISWKTKGDRNSFSDFSPVPAENLVGVYRKTIPVLGKVALFMRTPVGILLLILLPVMLFAFADHFLQKKEQRELERQMFGDRRENMRQEKTLAKGHAEKVFGRFRASRNHTAAAE